MFFVVSLLAGLGFAALSLYSALTERQATIDKIQAANLIAANQAAERLYSVFRAGQAIMEHLGEDLGRGEDIQTVIGDATRLIARFPGISYLQVIDRNGALVASTLNAHPPAINYADRPYFKEHQAGAELVIGEPLVGRMTGKNLLPLTLALHGPMGEFDGVLFIGVETAVIEGILQPGSESASALFRLDGTLLVHTPPAAVGQRYPNAQIFKEFTKAPHGSFITRSVISGDERLIGYSAVHGFPLLVNVSVNKASALAEWRSHVGLVVTLNIVVISVLLAFGWRDLRRTGELQHSRNRFEVFAEASSDWFWEMDRDLRFSWFSKRFASVTGRDPGAIIGKRREDLILEMEPQALDRHLDDLRAHRPFRDFVYPVETSVGLKYFCVSGFPLLDDAGQFAGYRGVGSDVTRVKEDEIRLRRIMETTAEGIFGVDEKGCVIFANSAAAALLGWPSPEAMVGNSSPEVCGHLLADGRPCTEGQCSILLVGRDGQSRRVTDEMFKGRHQMPIPVEYVAAPLDISGKIVGAVVAFHDISESRRAEEQLRRSKLEAETANRAKSIFLANMSHEIRTPMNGIIGLAYLARNGEMDAVTRERVEGIATSAQRLLCILNDILDISKVEAGKVVLESIPFEVNRLIENNISAIRTAATAKGVALALSADPDMPQFVIGDPLRIGQVLLNLLSNAIKFTEIGSITVDVKVVETTGDKIVTRFSVTDTGIGLSPDQQEKLFQKFQQADDSITRKYGGTGLGLSIVKQLTELMGGQIGVTSTLGTGSCFWFSLALGLAKDHSTAAEASTTPPLSVEPELVRGALTLLVEDDPVNRMVALGLLDAAGMRVDVAVNGAEAVSLVEGDKGYEVVLMDMHMPIMDGLSATRRIRSNPKFAELPIIAMTAGVLSDDRESCLAAGMTDFIGNPFTPEQFYSVIEKWVTGLGDSGMFDAKTRAKFEGQNIRLPHDIEGLDIRAGLRRVAGMRELYIQTLRRFLEDSSDVVERLRQLIGCGDVQAAVRAAHTLKGAAGMIEAREIFGLALAVEQVLDDGNVDASGGLITRLEAKINPLLQSLRRALDVSAEEAILGGSSSSRAKGPSGQSILASLAKLVWRDSYKCGDPEIDSQHQALIGLANQALTALLSGLPHNVTAASIDLLIGAFVRHFRDEEAVLATSGYPNVAEHALQHRELLDRAAYLTDRFRSGTLGFGEMCKFLTEDLIAQHMLDDDRKFLPYLEGRLTPRA